MVPVTSKEGRWALYGGAHKVHTSSLPFTVLYFYAAATLEDISRALNSSAKHAELQIVFPETLRPHMSRPDVEKQTQRYAKGVWTLREYLVSFIKSEVQAYLTNITSQAPTDYIDPFVETPSRFKAKTPNPVLSFLVDTSSEESPGKLGIVLAEPGQGKTYMSHFLVAKIPEVDRGLFPLMVDSSQWHTMSLEDQRSLEKTIAHSFRHFGATIGWLDGNENEFLRSTLSANIFRLVFDGFDEYVLRNRGAVQPMEVLEALANLAADTGTRIVITSRTSFWKTNLPDVEVEEFLERSGALIFTIAPFDLSHARNYFAQKLTTRKAAVALKLYAALKEGKDESLVGRGFVLKLIADLADEGASSANDAPSVSNPMLWLIEALCQREMLRQGLPLTAREQLDVFQAFAVEVAEGAPPEGELLDLTIESVHNTIDAASLRSTREKLKSHPLLENEPKTGFWRFKQEQIRILFLAEHIVCSDAGKIERFVLKASLEPESWQDLGTSIVDVVVKQGNSEERLRDIIRAMSSVSSTDAGRMNDGSRLAGVVSLTAVEKLLPKGSSHEERAALLLRLCGGDSIKDLNFSGTVARFDFRGVTFENCRFDRIAWANCTFSEKTRFSKCQFVGGAPPAHCREFGRIELSNCRLDPDAEAILNSERVRAGVKNYSSDDLRSDIQSVIERFITKGGLGLRSVESATLTRGTIGASRHRDEIIETLKDTVLEEHRISGSSASLRGYHVRDDASESVRFYSANNVFTGQLRDAFDRLRQRLKLS
jgi:hypothetical protein